MTTRPGRWGTWRPLDLAVLVLVVGFVVGSLGPYLVGARLMLDTNIFTQFQPFSAIRGVDISATSVCRGDTVENFFPSFVAARDGLRSGHLQSWLPWESGGSAFAALPSSALFSPLTLPYYLAPVWLAPTLVKLLEMLVAIVGMVGLARRHGMSWGAGLLGGAVFAASGFLTMWTNWSHPEVAALIPALFWSLECVVRTTRPRVVVGLALVLAAMLLGGFPAVVLYSLTVGGVYVLVRSFQVHGRSARVVGAVVRAAGGVVLGIALTAVQMVPFVLGLRTFISGREDIGAVPLPLWTSVTTVAPSAIGLCRGGDRLGRVNPVEGVGYVGAAALLLALVAVVWLPRRGAAGSGLQRFGAIATPVTAFVIWVGGPLLAALQVLPFYSNNAIGRAQSVLLFLVSAMCAVGFERIAGRRKVAAEPEPDDVLRRGSRRVWAVLVTVAVLVFATLATRGLLQQAHATAYEARMPRLLLTAAGLLALAAVLLVVSARAGRRLRGFALLAVVALALLQSAQFLRAALPNGDRDLLYPVTPTHAYLRDHIGHDRYDASGRMMYTATTEAYRLRTATGHQFTPQPWQDLLRSVDPDVMLSRTYSSLHVTPAEAARSRVLDRFGVRYWVGHSYAVPGRPAPRTADAATGRVRLRPGAQTSCTVPAGPLRAVEVEVEGRERRDEAARAVLAARVETDSGSLRGASMLAPRLRAGRLTVPVVGERLAGDGQLRVTLSLSGTRRALVLAGDGTQVSCRAVRPRDDGLRLVSASAGAAVYLRTESLGRIRWAGRSEVVRDGPERVRRLTTGLPDDVVLLDDDTQPAGGGGSASVSVMRDSGAHVSALVDARTGGYLVVADAVDQPGWTATVDGEQVPLVAADHAFGAVHVPAGRHDVALAYTAPGLRTGAVVSAVAGVVSLLLLLPWRRRRARAGDHLAQGVAAS